VSAVNWAEVVQRLARERVDVRVLRARAVASGLVIVDFDVALAEATGALWEATRAAGLSLGDRACLALARATGATAVTADRAWVALDVGVEVRLVR
jgi:PIN domain nuclease of toxin-antitoxin system